MSKTMERTVGLTLAFAVAAEILLGIASEIVLAW
jgi:hypothetical protein